MAHQPGAGAREPGSHAQIVAPSIYSAAASSRRDAIVAIATAPGRAALGIVRLSGSGLARFGEALTGSRLQPRTATLAAFKDETGAAIDRGLALFFPAPASYTGEDVLELHGHGGPVVLQMVLKRCVELGARLAGPGEFTQRAFLNGKLDLVQAEAVIDLIEAGSTQAARGAMRSLEGAFSSVIRHLESRLTELRALLEATLDFPEEDVDPLHEVDVRARLEVLDKDIASALDAARHGNLVREGLRVTVVGRPNVGKSSLLNRLAGEELAIVTDVPGTTRDTIRSAVHYGGMPIQIVDTAGLRDTDDPVERIGVDRAWQAIADADLIIFVSDARESGPEDAAIVSRLPPETPRISVLNKVDLTGGRARIENLETGLTIWLSASTGEGVDVLEQELGKRAGTTASTETLFLARERHLAALHETRTRIAAALSLREPELIAEEARLAHLALSTITGEVTSDDLLGEIFGRFCIGK